MIIDYDQLNFLSSTSQSPFQKLHAAKYFALWPNSTVIYSFDKSILQDITAKSILIDAMKKIENVSCVRFEPKSNETIHYVLMMKGKTCSSKVGFRSKGPQTLFIDSNLCSVSSIIIKLINLIIIPKKVGSIVHELLHTLSFLHMHTAKNRDEHVIINWENVREDAKINFEIFSSPDRMLHTEYDYDSITHYSNFAFAKNKQKPTIIAKKPSEAKNMGQRKGIFYKCPDMSLNCINAKYTIRLLRI